MLQQVDQETVLVGFSNVDHEMIFMYLWRSFAHFRDSNAI